MHGIRTFPLTLCGGALALMSLSGGDAMALENCSDGSFIETRGKAIYGV